MHLGLRIWVPRLPARARGRFLATLAGGLILAPLAGSPAGAAPATAATAPSRTATDNDFADFGDLDLASLLDARVESASGDAEQISHAPAVIEVVTPDQIRAWGATNLYDVLAHVAGVEVVENHWGRATVNLRGLHTNLFNNKVLLLIDNHPLYETGNQSFFLEQIPINAVARVEIIRGPGGVLFGTNAYAGVIHVFTKEPGEDGARVSLGAGAMVPDASGPDDDPLAMDFRASGSVVWEDGYGQVDVQFYQTPLWRAEIPRAQASNAPNAPLVPHGFARQETNVAVVGKVAHAVGDNRFRLLGGFHDQTKLKWGLIPTADVPDLPSSTQNAFIAGYWDRSLANVDLSARLGFDSNTQLNEAGILPAAGFFPPERRNDPLVVEVDTHKYEAAFSVAGDLFDELLRLSGGFQGSAYNFREYGLKFASDGALAPTVPELDYGPLTLDLNAFGQATVRPTDALSLVAGARLNWFDPAHVRKDLPDPAGELTVNPRAAVIYAFTEQTTGKLLYGRAFRVPSVFELDVEAATIIRGNPDLKPETIDTFEAAVDTRPLDGLSLRLNGFANITDNDITFVKEADGAEAYVNGPGRRIFGVELSARYVLEEWLDAYLSAGFQEGRERGGNERYLDEIARVMGTASATLYLRDRDLRLTPTARYIGPRDDLGGAVLWDATAYYDITEQIGVGLVAKNVFDRRYADIEIIRGETPSGVIQNQPRTLMGWLYGRF